MEYADVRLSSVVEVDGFQDAVLIADQVRNIVLLAVADGVPSVVSKVVDDQVEIISELGPKRVIEINRKAIAMTHDEPGARRISVPPQGGDGVIVKANLAHCKRLGDLPQHF